MANANLPKELLHEILWHCSKPTLETIRIADAKRGMLHEVASDLLFTRLSHRASDRWRNRNLSTCPAAVRSRIRTLEIEFFARSAESLDVTEDLHHLVAIASFTNLKRINVWIDCNCWRPPKNDVAPRVPLTGPADYFAVFVSLNRILHEAPIELEVSISLSDDASLACLRAAPQSGITPAFLRLQAKCIDCYTDQISIREIDSSFALEAKWTPRELDIDTSADLAILGSFLDLSKVETLALGDETNKDQLRAVPGMSACLASVRSFTFSEWRPDDAQAFFTHSNTYPEMEELSLRCPSVVVLSSISAPRLTSMYTVEREAFALTDPLRFILGLELPVLKSVTIQTHESGRSHGSEAAFAKEMEEIIAAFARRAVSLDINLTCGRSHMDEDGARSLPFLVNCLAPVLKTLNFNIKAEYVTELPSIVSARLPELRTLWFQCQAGKSAEMTFEFLRTLVAPHLRTVRYRCEDAVHELAFFTGLRGLLDPTIFPSLREYEGVTVIPPHREVQKGAFDPFDSLNRMNAERGIDGKHRPWGW